MSTLYLIAAPDGNPDDITLRALRLLGEVGAVATSTPQELSVLLAHHEVTPQRLIELEETLDALGRGTVALVGVGDLPAVGEDAAASVVREAIRQGHRVEPIPGASLVVTALVLSALPPDAFIYVGDLPESQLETFLAQYRDERATLIMTFRSEQLAKACSELCRQFGERQACLVIRPGSPDGVVMRGRLEAIAVAQLPVSGKAALVLAGAPEMPARVWDESEIRAALRQRLKAGEPLKSAAKAIAAESGWDRRSVYALGVND